MAPFFDSPLEIIEEIINSLQDNPTALKACSQTCSSLLPVCRKYIFRSIRITTRCYPQRSLRLPRVITLFGILLSNNPGISDLVQNLVFHVCLRDVDDDDVPRVLGRLHHLQSFELKFEDLMAGKWSTLRQPFRDALLRLIHLPSVSRLNISNIYDFPVTAFFPCINLADLALARIAKPTTTVAGYENGSSAQETSPQLQSFAFHMNSNSYAMQLLNARRPNGVPMLDFSEVRILSVEAYAEEHLMAIQAFIGATKKLETLVYGSTYGVSYYVYIIPYSRF